ncbi:MAG TPA: hypothetical protein DCE44_19860 [Verrucomicrobiales bacterium]|nr:hypothetical protein [Verrucomicrobiales bacterium]
MRTLVGTLDRMFERDTFRREPSVGLCTTQEWHSRLHSGMQTLLLFEAYDSFVEGEARSSLLRYRDLTAAIARYCLNMAAYLFHPPVGLSELRPLVGTVEFINQVREKKKTFEGGVDPATCREIDPHLGAAMSLMKGLHDEFWGDAESSQARPSIQDQSVVPIVPTRESREIAPESSQSSGPGPNRVFISYSADSPEHIQRVQEFAARLRADGIDVRIDTDVDLDPPEGWASYSQTQIEEATFVISICTETYRRRFDGREEPGRGKGVTFEGRLIRQEIFDSQGRTKKFIPVLLNPADEAHIPTLLRDRSRYLVTDAVSNAALNYQSLLRRLR